MGTLSFVKLYDFFFFRGNGTDIILNFPENDFIINRNAVKGHIQDIPQNGRSTVNFTDEQVGRFNAFQTIKGIFPFPDQSPEFRIKIFYLFTFGNSTDNNSVVMWFNTLNQGFQDGFFLRPIEFSVKQKPYHEKASAPDSVRQWKFQK